MVLLQRGERDGCDRIEGDKRTERRDTLDKRHSDDDLLTGAVDATARRICIVVLGMHRSGTSALTRALSLLGAELPKNLLPGNFANPMGYWEPARLVSLHDAMLAEAGSRWEDWRAFDPKMLGPDRLAYYEEEILRIIAEEYGDASLFLMKDPRMCRMMPLWLKLLRRVDADVRFALPLRNPIEVGRSLEQRTGLSYAHGCLLWLRHVLEAEQNTRGMPRVFVHYHDLLRDPNKTIANVASQLVADWPPVSNGLAERIVASIDPRMRHHVARQEELHHPVPFHSWLSEAYDACTALVQAPNDKKAQHQLDRIRAAFDFVTDSFAPLVSAPEAAVKEREDRIVLLEQTLGKRDAELSERDSRLVNIRQALSVSQVALQERNASIAALNQALAAREAALEEQDRKTAALDQALAASEAAIRYRDKKIATLDRALATTETALNERDERLATLDRMLTERTAEVAASAKTIAEQRAAQADSEARLAISDSRLRALYASTSWRVTAPLRAIRRYSKRWFGQ